jgi:hypothetical protein
MAYKQEFITDKSFTREFSKDVETTELIWHRDKKDRKVTVMEGTDWKIQFDNSLPKDLIKGNVIEIPKMVFHRLWRGKDNLIIQIEESDGI